MGAFDWLGQSLDWVKNRWNEDWSDFRKTFSESWTSLPDAAAGVNNGIIGMVTAPFKDDGDFWGSARMWLDSAVNTGSALAGGTIGTLFQIPILHEASWLLDKAYRYGVARPISTSWTFMSNSHREAYMQGANPAANLWDNLTDYREFQKAWNDSEYITPGQAIVYQTNMAIRGMGDFEESMKWADAHDPRTQAGQKTFNAKDSEFWLKYTSGSLDFAGNLLADPGHGAAVGAKLAKLRLVDKVADARYVMARKVQDEPGTSAYKKVQDIFKNSETPEEARNLTMPQAVRGGQISTLLWTAARMGDDVYRDTYLSIRAFDVEAYKRLSEKVPAIAASYADLFANFTIADFAYQRGNVQNATSADALRKTKVEALVDSFAQGEGIWGDALGLGFREKMPRARAVSALRAGYHSWALESAPIAIGRPLSNLMPSQGWSPIINAGDTTGMGLRMFKANLERANTMSKAGDLIHGDRDLVISPAEINDWTSRYGAATSDATRQTISMEVDDLVISRILERYGLSKSELSLVLDDLNKTRAGTRRLVANERVFMSREARKAADRAVQTGRMDDAAAQRAIADEIEKDAAEGRGADEYFPATGADGQTHLVPLDTTLPVLRSQFTEVINMLDYRALNGALRWYRMVHPKPRVLPDPDDATKTVTAPLTPWELGLSKAAKARGWYDQTINMLDSISTIWKASALFRPSQAPRNVASDWAMMFAEFGKLPMLLSAANIIPNTIRNFGPRGSLVWEMLSAGWARQRGQAPARTQVRADVEVNVPGNANDTPVGKPKKYFTSTAMFADGYMSLQGYLNFLDGTFSEHVSVYSKKTKSGTKPPPKAPLFVPRASQQGITEGREAIGLSGNRPEKIDPTKVPGGKKPPPEKLPYQPGEKPDLEDFSIPGQGARVDQPGGWAPGRDFKAPEKTSLPGEGLGTEWIPGQGPPHGFPLGTGEHRGRRNEVPAPYAPWRLGTPYFLEYQKWKAYKEGLLNENQYRQAIVTIALQSVHKTKYMEKPWGVALIKDLVTRHINRRQDPDYKDNPYAPGTLVFDPFTGLQPTIADEAGKKSKIPMRQLRDNFDIASKADLETRNIPKKKKGSIDSVALGDVHKQLVRFINDNADDLLKPNTLLALRVKPDGNISVGVATAKRHVVEAGETLKAGSAYARIKDFRFTDIKDSAHTGFDLVDGKGNVIASLEGWASGPNGQMYQRRVSARDNPTTGFGNIVEDIDVEKQLDEVGPQRTIYSHEVEYPANWERDVNAQLASDPVAQLFLRRKANGEYYSDVDVISAVEDSAWGNKWIHAMAFRGVAYVDHIRIVGANVDKYIPGPKQVGDDKAAAAVALREAVLRKKATYKDFEKLYEQVGKDGKVFVDKDVMPEIHGPSIRDAVGIGRAFKGMRRTIRTIQRYISDMPVDKWARFPFMAMAYKKHGTELGKVANSYFPDGPLPADVVKRIKDMSLEKAYHDVRYRLYDTAQRNDFAYATRLLMPFSAAMMDSYIKYGRVIRENPMTLVQGAYYWDVFERNGMVQDEEGNVAVKEDGRTVFYSVDPKTGERTLVPEDKVGKHRYVQFQLPDSLGKVLGQKYYGVDAKPVIAINKDTMNVFLNNPSGGPLVAFPANEFALNNPEFGENTLVKKYLLPYGPSASRGKVFLPTTVRAAWDAFLAEDGTTAEGHAMAIMQAELTAYALGTRNTPPTFEEVREKAASMVTLRFLSTNLSPASFQLQSPYQPYVNAYRQLLADPATSKNAAEEFMKRYGDEYYAVTMSVTRNNAGLSATLESSEAYDKYQTLIQRYPEFGGLIVGSEGAGSFAKSVYEAQKDTPVGPGDKRTIREMMSLQESTEQVQSKITWTKYGQMMDLITAAMVDRGARSLNHRGAHDLLAVKEAFVEANKYWMDPATGERSVSPWYTDYMSTDGAAQEKKMSALWAIANDEKLQNREDIRGLLEYLTARHAMQVEMGQWNMGSLANQKAWGLKNKWEQQVHEIVEANPAFGDLWNRWLSTDNRLDESGIEIPDYYGR